MHRTFPKSFPYFFSISGKIIDRQKKMETAFFVKFLFDLTKKKIIRRKTVLEYRPCIRLSVKLKF